MRHRPFLTYAALAAVLGIGLGLAGCAAPPEPPLGPLSRANFYVQLDRPRDALEARAETPRLASPEARPAPARAASPARPAAMLAPAGGRAR